MIYCPACGAANYDNSPTCQQCRQPLPASSFGGQPQGGFGAPPTQPAGSFGAPQAQGPFGAPSTQPAGSFGATSQPVGFAPQPGAPPGWGMPPQPAGMVPAGQNFGGAFSAEGYSDKDQATAFLLAALLGWLGADRFYLGQTGLGIAKLLTCEGLGIWGLIDAILIGTGKMKDAFGRPLRRDPPVGQPTRSQTIALLLSYFLGYLGADRFYLGYTGLGIAKLLTCGGFGLWALIDAILIGMGKMKDAEGNSLLFDP